ncbi:UNVERIFIED_CONTAM: hypothetical protein Slati_3530700 [Sesamum latifolium]|uniref:Reverse transcriptase zinc-binding domain-containing protein n=1 Tax=Sesamum latifolium TaxID=2727402 RepID=A0AAW2UK85_9LAMI
MVKRMQLVLEKLIDNTQNTFVLGRNIATNVLLAQELLAGYNQKKLPPRCTIKEAVQSFKELPGLQANAQKSQVITSKAAAQHQVLIMELMGFSQGTLPVKYLEVPLISSKLTTTDCAPLIQKIEFRITGWNQLNLSYASRTQLIRSILSSIHLYCSSVFILPKGVLKVIENKLRDFLWKGPTGNGRYKVSWEQLDPWLIDGPLIVEYPRDPILTGLPSDSWLNVVIEDGEWKWPSKTRREIVEIIAKLPSIHCGAADQTVWKNATGKFSSSDAYSIFSLTSDPVPWSSLLWGRFATPIHSFILWFALLQRLSTLDKSWCYSGGNQFCILCDQSQLESHTHLFFKCTYAKTCVRYMKDKVRFSWPHSDLNTGILWASKRWRGSHLLNAASRALFASMCIYYGKNEMQTIPRHCEECRSAF